MRLALPASLLLAFTVVTGAASCGASQQCTPQSCASGCCSGNGECLGGGLNTACGAGGLTCLDCSAVSLVCTNQACTAVSGTGGGTGTGGGSGGGTATGGGTGTGGGSGFVCDRHTVPCADQAIMNLDLKSTVAPGVVVNTADGTGWRSTIDSRAGATSGLQSPPEGYVYARFTDQGLSKLPLTDMAALDSLDWDIAFRRFVVRINGGDSGPSCVAAQVIPNGTSYASITAVPSGLVLEGDDFYTDTCAFLNDGKGLMTSPNTYLSSFYDYPAMCVKMTNLAYVLRLQDGRHVKLTIDTYYQTEVGQTTCDTTGTSGGVGGGTIRMRWQYLD